MLSLLVWALLDIAHGKITGSKAVSSVILEPQDDFRSHVESPYIDELAQRLTEDDILPSQDEGMLFRSVFKPARLWPGGVVPYAVERDVARDPDRMGVLDYAFRTFHKFTCVRFRPREARDANFVRFVDGGDMRCFSFVGMIGGDQTLSLGRGCEVKTGIALHELAHALGIVHEHSRPDRDEFLTVQHDNIKTGKHGQFKKLSHALVDVQELPFDYSSIMIYRAHAFSKNGEPTILTKEPSEQDRIGQRKGFSACDLEKINRAYQCPKIKGNPECGDAKDVTTTTAEPATTTAGLATTTMEVEETTEACVDEDDDLCEQAREGPYRCLKYPGAFLLRCKRSCDNCAGRCEDAEPNRCRLLYKPYCHHHKFVQYKCPRTCGLCPKSSMLPI